MKYMYKYGIAAALGCALLGTPAFAASAQEEFVQLHQKYVTGIAPLSRQAKISWWNAETVGDDASYAERVKATNALTDFYNDPETFAKLKALRDSKAIVDPMQKRELDVMYYEYLPYQVDPELSKKISAKEAEVERIFNTHRSPVGDKKLTENEVRKILTESTDSEEAKQAWLGYMALGNDVAAPLHELILLRNQMAQKLGYRDFFAMQLDMQELDETELMQLFDELDTMTRPAFTELKGQIDDYMAKRFNIEKKDLRPWHLGDLFFQEAPEIYSFDTNSLYAGKDPVKLSQKYFLSMGLDPRAIHERSDLYERPNKSPHAFQETMDRDQDIRLLCNIKPNASWMDTICHESGHGLYDQHIDKNLPYTLRTASHIMTTEGIAMLMGRLTRSRDFLQNIVEVPADKLDEAAKVNHDLIRAEKLIFSRWTQTMLHFEKEMYANPDQDLNKLWWDLKAKYQLQNPPDDMSGHDYGAKMHIVGAAVYYHNYMLGDLIASQLYKYAAQEVAGLEKDQETSFYGHPEVGEYLKVKVFSPGNLYNWRDLTIHATGKPLDARAFSEMYVK